MEYAGDTHIDGVPGTASKIVLNFLGVAGSSCGTLLPTGRSRDCFDGVNVTSINNSMPVVLVRASDQECTGYETREQLDADDELKLRLESIRLQAGPLMRLGDVAQRSVPKMTLVARPRGGHQLSNLHSASLPCLDWRFWRGERRLRLPNLYLTRLYKSW